MPYKNVLCGIYKIACPSGSCYIGSSINILYRWCQHRSYLRRGVHHSPRLQAAYAKYGDRLTFEVLMLCDRSELITNEQAMIDAHAARLNSCSVVDHVRSSPDAVAKLKAIHSSPEWSAARSQIAKKIGLRRGIVVDCSNGVRYPTLAHAARAFGIKAAGIAWLISTHRIGRLGVRFKRAEEEWRDSLPSARQRVETRKANGTLKHTDATRARMSASAKRRDSKRARNGAGQYA